MARFYDPNTRQWVESPTPANATAPGGLTLSGSTYVRNPTGGQTVSGQMTGLLSGNSDYIRMNERAGQNFAAGRGLMNSTLAAQAGRQAAIQSALPIATADAQMANQAAAQNMDALNEMQALEMQRQAATASTANANVGAQYNMLDSQLEHDRRLDIMREQSRLDREGAREDRDWRSGESRADRDWRTGESDRDRAFGREGWANDRDAAREDRDWRSGEARRDRDLTREGWANDRDAAREQNRWNRENLSSEQRAAFFRDMMQMMGGTLFSDPSFWRDPDGASGFLNFFSGQFGGLFDSFFSNRGNAFGGG